jgi:hypothetical protein
MKKVIRNVFVALALLGSGAGLTSCDSETLQALLPAIIQMLMGGQVQTYSGTAELEGLEISSYNEKGEPIYLHMKTDFQKTAPMAATVQVSQNTATITIPQFEVGGRVIKNLTVSGVTIENGTFEGGYQWAYTCTRSYGDVQDEQISVTTENQDKYHFDLLEGSIKATEDNSANFYMYACLYIDKEAYNIAYRGTLVKQ